MSINRKNAKNIPKPTHFGKNLKFLRRMNGLSQSELARFIGMSRNNVASYESGVVEPNTTKFLVACEFFKIDPKDMLDLSLAENPIEISIAEESKEKIVDKYLLEHMDQFVIQTNEMTKVFEGYKAFIEMKKETDSFNENKDLYAILEDILSLLQSLIESNWKLIQSVFPIEVNGD